MTMTRRETLAALAGGTAVLATAQAHAVAPPPSSETPAWPGPGKHAPKPLPFDPAKLKGISEKLIVSHHDNNYTAAVKNLNKVEEQLSQLAKDTAPFVVGGLKQSELTFANSMTLHENYFGNLGGSGKIGGEIEKAVAGVFGSAAKWEEQFRATGMSLGGGSGWVVLGYNFQMDAVQTLWSGNHTQALAFGAPLLVMDMYEHAYQMDYGAAAAKYVDAFFENIQWDEVNRRLERARRMAAALRG
jgi:Fe-Mn family superoxide dismutase